MNLNIIEKMKQRHSECLWRCQQKNCCKPSTEIAHKISNGKYGRKRIRNYCESIGLLLSSKQVEYIIHHKYNTFPSCKSHNDSFNLHISQTTKVEELIRNILIDLNYLKG